MVFESPINESEIQSYLFNFTAVICVFTYAIVMIATAAY